MSKVAVLDPLVAQQVAAGEAGRLERVREVGAQDQDKEVAATEAAVRGGTEGKL